MQAKAKQQGRDLAEQIIVHIAEGKNVEQVKRAILGKYGFLVTDEYARDLIAFVDALMQE